MNNCRLALHSHALKSDIGFKLLALYTDKLTKSVGSIGIMILDQA